MQQQKPQVICFGEVLWDNLPSGRQPGGAPMNVAYHLQQLGQPSILFSRVGRDAGGSDLLEVLHGLGLNTRYCQIDEKHPTSTVEVHLSPNQEVSYEIVFPVAWDFILYEAGFADLVANAGAFVYGSLVNRNPTSSFTLKKLLESPVYKVFDVNLREPFYRQDEVAHLLQQANLLKLNQHELEVLSTWYSSDVTNEQQQVQFLQKEFEIAEVIVTKGSKGATYYSPERQYYSPTFNITVQDTVGSGDAFLAAFLSQRLQGTGPDQALELASAVGAFIATQPGACPPYTRWDIDQFIQEQYIKTYGKSVSERKLNF